ncbi:MAG: GNAT family N-acetyltransferase [Candidatus Adiutricales bacterium]|jgi:ribosomal protein S18 acetylase RimI-like enzyme
MKIDIIDYKETHREWARDLLEKHWGSAAVVSRGKLYQADILSGFVAFIKGLPQGLVTYRIDGRECEIISLNSLMENRGIGTALIRAVLKAAVLTECHYVMVITTNDNERAQDFYRNRGFGLATVHKDAIQESRKLKPEIPEFGINGMPIKDEIEFRYIIRSDSNEDI